MKSPWMRQLLGRKLIPCYEQGTIVDKKMLKLSKVRIFFLKDDPCPAKKKGRAKEARPRRLPCLQTLSQRQTHPFVMLRVSVERSALLFASPLDSY